MVEIESIHSKIGSRKHRGKRKQYVIIVLITIVESLNFDKIHASKLPSDYGRHLMFDRHSIEECTAAAGTSSLGIFQAALSVSRSRCLTMQRLNL